MPEGLEIEYTIRLGFNTTNNEAEYEALIAGKYEAKEDRMKRYLTKVTELMSHFKAVNVRHISRSQNEQADRLA